jgi:tetratricopeptide (TPR) repeat protein
MNHGVCARCGTSSEDEHCPACREQLIALVRSILQWAGEKRPPAVDMSAESATPDMPSFAAPPAGAKPYHGFPLLDNVTASGFRLGMITNFLAFPETHGDAYVIAPDGSRAGLVWEESDRTYFEQAGPISEDRWGVWAAGFVYPMRSKEDARKNLETIVPGLRDAWQRWVRGEYDELVPTSELIERQRDLMGSDDPEVVARAALDLGDLLEEGDIDGAMSAFGRAMGSPLSWAVAWGAFRMAGLYTLRGTPDQAEEALRYAIAVGVTSVTGLAALELGALLEGRNDAVGAKEAYQTAMGSDDADAAAAAANQLAYLLQEEGDTEAAERLYREIVESGAPDAAGWAGYNLGLLLERRGDTAGAREVWRKSAESDPASGDAAYALGRLLEDEGDPHGALDAYQVAVSTIAAEEVGSPALAAAHLLEETGRIEDAVRMDARALDTGVPRHVGWALTHLGGILQRLGESGDAEQAYQDAIALGVPDVAQAATERLAGMRSAARR